jgi:tRNA-splicing ligase RtcB
VLSAKDVKDRLPDIVEGLFRNVPSGVGSRRKDLRLSHGELRGVLEKGARWAIANGFGTSSDLENIENQGCLDEADPDAVSDRAYERGKDRKSTRLNSSH